MAGDSARSDFDDARIIEGMTAQFARRRALLSAGARPLGWKVGFGAEPALKLLGIQKPLIGFLMADGRQSSGAVVSVAGWTKPVLEPEICVYMGRDLPAGAGQEQVTQSIAALGPALELADVIGSTEDVREILSNNIFQKGVVLGEPDRSRAGGRLDGLTGRVFRHSREVATVPDLEKNTGRILDIVAHVANTLARFGESLKAGEIIIAGSVTPPIFVEPTDSEVRFDLGAAGSVSINLL